MKKDEEIIIRVEKGKMKKLKELGISAQDVFSKGLYELLREKYGEYLTSDEDFDEFMEDDDFTDFIGPKNKFEEIIVPDSDMDNN
ncbi:hypothetical protein MBGDC06_00078 [Thermoplasmatales archaeon SCGC AB-539-C06]|nr:hypothetical protein MBGDC06_00078 [Thermoplasmatales archaeon SCGC AB-539-C06]